MLLTMAADLRCHLYMFNQISETHTKTHTDSKNPYTLGYNRQQQDTTSKKTDFAEKVIDFTKIMSI